MDPRRGQQAGARTSRMTEGEDDARAGIAKASAVFRGNGDGSMQLLTIIYRRNIMKVRINESERNQRRIGRRFRGENEGIHCPREGEFHEGQSVNVHGRRM
jgi:hypothetical protein